MPKIYGDLQRAQFESLGSNPATGTLGRFWWNTAEGKAFFDKSSANRPFLLNDDKAIIGNSGTAADNIRFHRGAAGVLQMVSGGDTTAEGILSTALNQLSFKFETYTDAGKPANGNAGRIVYLSDLQAWMGDDGSAWKALGGGSGGGSLKWNEGANAPLLELEYFNQVAKYETGLSQKLYTLIRVPDSYSAGRQIKLKLAAYSPDNTGTILLQTVATLIRKATDAMSSTTNQRTSTNSAITLSAGTVDEPQEISFDLTDTSGQVNGVAVGKGDLLVVELSRGTDTATSDIRALIHGAEVLLS